MQTAQATEVATNRNSPSAHRATRQQSDGNSQAANARATVASSVAARALARRRRRMSRLFANISRMLRIAAIVANPSPRSPAPATPCA